MKDRLCNCGNCGNAYERVRAMTAKMMADDECGIFIYAQAELLKAFAINSIASMLASGLPENITAEAEVAHIHKEGTLVTSMVSVVVQKYWEENSRRIQKDYAAIVANVNEATKARENLPKGD